MELHPMKIKKSIWIEEETIADIENEANERGTKFSIIANERLKQRTDIVPPSALTKTQNIINLCRKGKFDEAQQEENKLWKF